MNGKFNLCPTGHSFLIAISLGFSCIESSSTRSNRAEAVSNRREQIQEIRSRHHDSTNRLTDSQLMPASAETAGRNPFGHQIAQKQSGEAPGWTIPYGREFWRRSIKPARPEPNDP